MEHVGGCNDGCDGDGHHLAAANTEVDIETRSCDECDGMGTTVQGWTDKNGYPEDQYGTCPTCFGHGTAEAPA